MFLIPGRRVLFFSWAFLATLVPGSFNSRHSFLPRSKHDLVISFVNPHCQPPLTPGSFIRIGLASFSLLPPISCAIILACSSILYCWFVSDLGFYTVMSEIDWLSWLHPRRWPCSLFGFILFIFGVPGFWSRRQYWPRQSNSWRQTGRHCLRTLVINQLLENNFNL